MREVLKAYKCTVETIAKIDNLDKVKRAKKFNELAKSNKIIIAFLLMFLSNGCTAFSIEYGLDKVLINSNQVGFDSEYEVIGFSPEIQIDFFNRLFRDSINSRTVQLFKNTDELRTSIPLTFYFDKNDQSAVVRLSSHLAELESETSYTLNLLKNISFADGIKLGQDYAVKFKTSILNNAASVRLTFNGEDIFENNAVFSVTIKNTDDISKVPLTIKVSKGSELKVENQIMALSDNVYVGTLDFTASLTKKITVTSEDLKLSKDYEIKLVISNVNAEKKFISEFKITRTLNPLLSMDYMATIDEASQIITLKLPAKTNLTKLVPSITFVGKKLVPETAVSQNFTTSVLYKVIGYDDVSRDYSVQITTP